MALLRTRAQPNYLTIFTQCSVLQRLRFPLQFFDLVVYCFESKLAFVKKRTRGQPDYETIFTSDTLK